jgi:hypothetical protein
MFDMISLGFLVVEALIFNLSPTPAKTYNHVSIPFRYLYIRYECIYFLLLLDFYLCFNQIYRPFVVNNPVCPSAFLPVFSLYVFYRVELISYTFDAPLFNRIKYFHLLLLHISNIGSHAYRLSPSIHMGSREYFFFSFPTNLLNAFISQSCFETFSSSFSMNSVAMLNTMPPATNFASNTLW